MKRIIRLTESDLARIVRRVIKEEKECPCEDGTKSFECCESYIRPPKELGNVTLTGYRKDNKQDTQDTQNNFEVILGMTPFESLGKITYNRGSKQLSYIIDIDANLNLRDVIEKMKKLSWIDNKTYKDLLKNL